MSDVLTDAFTYDYKAHKPPYESRQSSMSQHKRKSNTFHVMISHFVSELKTSFLNHSWL